MSATHHIRNPFELALERLSSAFVEAGDAAVKGRAEITAAPPAVRRIGVDDLKAALKEGMGDLGASRADALFVVLIYPIAGLLLGAVAFNYNLMAMIFPLVAGFALIGPLAAVGLYEVSRHREQGLPISWSTGFEVFRSPALGSILWLGFTLLVLFALWLAAAWGIYQATLGPLAPETSPGAPVSTSAFLASVFETPQGWAMIAAGMIVGFLFAALALSISVVSIPLLLDRNVGMSTAIRTSLRAVAANPGTMSLWGLTVAGLLVLGSIPALAGLIVVIPLLGHATWRLYRRVVAPEG